MTHPTAKDVGERVRVLGNGLFSGRCGEILGWSSSKSKPVRVGLDNDAPYSWMFAKKELELLVDGGA